MVSKPTCSRAVWILGIFLSTQVLVTLSQGVCHVTSQGTKYVYYKDEGTVTWTGARERCNKQGQIMPEPPLHDEDAIALRRVLANTCGEYSFAWLSAVGDGTQFVTQPGGRHISNTSPLWRDERPGSRVTTQHCMYMDGWKLALQEQPGSPYGSWLCSDSIQIYPLCQEPYTTSTGIAAIVPGPVITPQVTNVSPEAEPFWCSLINKTACASEIHTCPITCSQKSEPFWCSLINNTVCSTARIQCPVKCSQTHAATAITPGGAAPVITPQVTNATPASCGQSLAVDERIFNGKPSIAGQFPWMVDISYFSRFHGEPISCGGSLINKRWVLTAAHCFRYLDSNIDVNMKIGYTDKFRREAESYYFGIQMKDIIIHGGFTNESLDNDIAIVRLPEDVTFNRLVQPICLATNEQIPFGGKAVAAGWGLRKADEDSTNILHSVELDVLPDQSPRCANSQLFICTFTNGKDTCRGDSGGPLMTKQGNTWFQIGIVSSGPLDCGGHTSIPGTYTRVPNFIGFLLGYIRV